MTPPRVEPTDASAPERASPPAPLPAPGAELLSALQRVERGVADVRSHLEAADREQSHREFSPLRLIAALLQVIAIGLFIVAVADWAYQGPPGDILVKLGFAVLLQLGVLTAVLATRHTPA